VLPSSLRYLHSHHFIIRATQFSPELEALIAAMTSYMRATAYVGLKPTLKALDLLVLNDDDIADLVRAAIKREGSQAAFAERYGINRTDISAFLNGRRSISASLAKALGLRRVWVVE
jgi:hypothetical protein